MNAKRAGAMAKIGKRVTTNLFVEKQYEALCNQCRYACRKDANCDFCRST